MFNKFFKNLFFNDEFCYFCKENNIKKDYLCKDCLNRIFEYNKKIFEDYPKEEYKKDILYYYKGILKEKIKKFKFDDYLFLKKPLGKLIYKKLDKNLLSTIDYITFVPVSNKKIKTRGYNQCELLANEVSNYSKIEVLEILKKIKETKDQHFLNIQDRNKNLKNSFEVVKNIKGKRIILIDDIHTSGNTVDECYKTLKNAGVEFVWIVCVCGVR